MAIGYVSTQVLNGLVLGSVLILMSIGLTLIFGLMGVVNFAHGEFLTLGAYMMLVAMTNTGNFFVGLLLGILVVGIIGMIFERTLLKYTYKRRLFIQLLLTFGFAFVLREIIRIIWGSGGKPVPRPAFTQGPIDLGILTYPRYRLFLILCAFAVVFVLYLMLTRTNLGLIIRAATQDQEMVDLVGIDTQRIYFIVFGISAAVAGIAGALLAPTRGVSPLLGFELLITAFVVVIVGGMGSFKGTLVSGLLIGQLIILTGVVFPKFSQIIVFMFMAVVLLIRPKGLFGEVEVLDF